MSGIDENTFDVSIEKCVSEKKTPYTEICFQDKYDPIRITFRAYPKNIFVAVDDQTDNPFSGADLDDCFIIPPIITEKTPKHDFVPRNAFIKACKRVYGEDGDYEYYYREVEEEIKKWLIELQ